MTGRSPSGQALVASDEARSDLHPTGFDPSREMLIATAEAAATHLKEVIRLRAENTRLHGLLNNARAKAKAAAHDFLRDEADAALPHFTPSWEPLKDVAKRGGFRSAAWLVSRARELQSRGLIESKWIGRDRTQFKVWRLKGRPVRVHASGGGQFHASAIEARSDATGTGAAEGESAASEAGDAQ